MIYQKKKFKSLLLYSSRMSGLTSPRLCARVHTSTLQRWRVVGNVWEIWSGQDFNPIPPAPAAAEELLLAPSGWFEWA